MTQHATTTLMPQMMMALVRMLKPDTTAMANASQTPMATEYATRLKSRDVQTPLRPTTIHLQRMTTLHASNPFASIPKRVTTPSSVAMTTASLYSHTKSMKEWLVIKTSLDMSLTASTSRRKIAMTSSQVFLVTSSSQRGSCRPEASYKAHSVDCSDQTRILHSSASSPLPNTIAM